LRILPCLPVCSKSASFSFCCSVFDTALSAQSCDAFQFHFLLFRFESLLVSASAVQFQITQYCSAYTNCLHFQLRSVPFQFLFPLLRIQLCLTGCSKSFSPSFSSCCSVLDSALLIHLSYTFGSTPAVPVCVSAVQFRFLPSSFKYCSDSIVVPRLSISVSAIENQLLKISFRYCSADNIVINLSFSVFAVCGPNLSSNMASC
jgi:hypothetical protein